MKTALICHEGAKISQEGLARWLGSFSELVGIIVIKEPKSRKLARIKMEIKRVGFLRFLDVLAFRLYYKLFLSKKDKQIEQELLDGISEKYAPVPSKVPILYVKTPNSDEARNFLSDIKPDSLIARCKTLLKREIFTIPSRGTYVLHPGACSALKSYLDNPALASKYGRKAREAVQSRFSMELMVQNTVEFYKEIMKER